MWDTQLTTSRVFEEARGSIIFWGFPHSMYQYFIPFLCWVVFHCVYDYPFTNWHLVYLFTISWASSLLIWVIMSKAVMNIHVQVLVWICFISLGYTPGSGSYGKFRLNSLKNCQTVFWCGYTILSSHQQCMPVSPYSPQHLVWSPFFCNFSNFG